jgi:hypothetical protein
MMPPLTNGGCKATLAADAADGTDGGAEPGSGTDSAPEPTGEADDAVTSGTERAAEEAGGTTESGTEADDGPDPGTVPAETPPGSEGAVRRDERAPTARRRAGGPLPGDAGLFCLPDIYTTTS